jgi:hypothetical protein
VEIDWIRVRGFTEEEEKQEAVRAERRLTPDVTLARRWKLLDERFEQLWKEESTPPEQLAAHLEACLNRSDLRQQLARRLSEVQSALGVLAQRMEVAVGVPNPKHASHYPRYLEAARKYSALRADYLQARLAGLAEAVEELSGEVQKITAATGDS